MTHTDTATAARTVLVAEDDEDVRDLVVFKLAKAGYRILTAANGNSALIMAQSERPDLVVLDIDMPGIDGLAVCQQLNALARTSRIPVLMLSGRSRDLDVSLGRTMGADEYMVKPFHPEDLVETVGRLLTGCDA